MKTEANAQNENKFIPVTLDLKVVIDDEEEYRRIQTAYYEYAKDEFLNPEDLPDELLTIVKSVMLALFPNQKKE